MHRPLAFCCLCLVTSTVSVGKSDEQLLGHWTLAGTAQDASEYQRHAINHGADLQATGPAGNGGEAAFFDGLHGHLEIPPKHIPRLGAGEFSLAVWVHPDGRFADVPGEIVSLFDPRSRRGFSLGITQNSGVTTNQANARQVHFGIDNDRFEPRWTDHGRPGRAMLVFALAVYAGDLYAGTCEPGLGEAGHVYRLDKSGEWADCGSPHPCNSVSALAVYNGHLYAGVSKYRLAGSALPESENQTLGGRVYRYAGNQQWIDCGPLPNAEAVGGLVVYDDRLYASSLYRPAGFFRYEGDQAWTSLAVPNEKRVEAMTVYNGRLFATSYDQGHVFRFDGQNWTDCGEPGGGQNTQTYSFAVHWGKLFVGTWPSGRVYRYDGDNSWIDTGRLGEELEVMGMLVHNGSLFAGTLPLAEVYRYEAPSTWRKVGWLDQTPDVKYRRAWTMAEYQGRLFCGTLPSGHVWSNRAGSCVTCDQELAPGWRHLAAVRARDRLRLYIDGELTSESAPFAAEEYDLSIDAPLYIGFGPTDYFHGKLRDVRLYGRALQAAEVRNLARP